MNDHELFELGDVVLQEGATLRDAKLAYKTYGTLNDDKSNAIVYPTWYSGQHWENEWLIGEGMALYPTEYFIIVPNMLGNGLSSSPRRILPFCGSAKTSLHNIVFLEGVKAALTADAAWNHGWYDEQPTKGLRAMARVYAGWGFSQAFHWEEVYREMGYSSLEDFLVGFWEGFFLDGRDANNLLCMLWTWQNGDISKTPGFGGDYDKALASIEAGAIVMPAEKDLYFPPEDEEYAVRRMPNAELRVIPGVWGHFAGGGINPEDTKFIDDALKELLGS